MRFLTVFVCGLLFIVFALAHEVCSKAECEETKQKIRKIQATMRQGYTRKQGEKLETELRSLRAIRFKQCG